MYNELSNLGLSAIRRITDLWRGAKSDSLIDYTQVTRVEPIALIDADCLYLDLLPEVQQSMLSIFAGYYLQAVAISTTVGKIEVHRHLDKLNPKRNPVDSAADTAGWLLATENYKFALPTPQKYQQVSMESLSADEALYYADRKDRRDEARHLLDMDNIQATRTMKESEIKSKAAEVKQAYDLNRDKFGHDKAMAIAQKDLQERGLALQQAKLDQDKNASSIGFGKDTASTLKDLANLSVGKQFSVEITDGNHSASIPVNIRLMASSMPPSNLVHILSLNSQDNSMKERYHAWKSGRLEFVKDLMFCQDLIDAHRKNLMADKDGIYSNLVKRSRNNGLATLVSGNPSVATASNIVIMSSDTAAQLELQINGKISDFKTREKIFKEGYIMIMAVIDKQWERVTFYHRNIAHHTEVGVRDLKAANKGNGPDVSEILKAYQVGQSPSL